MLCLLTTYSQTHSHIPLGFQTQIQMGRMMYLRLAKMPHIVLVLSCLMDPLSLIVLLEGCTCDLIPACMLMYILSPSIFYLLSHPLLPSPTIPRWTNFTSTKLRCTACLKRQSSSTVRKPYLIRNIKGKQVGCTQDAFPIPNNHPCKYS